MFHEVPFHLDILSTNMRVANGSMQISMMKNICGKKYIVRCVVNASRRNNFKWTLVKQKGTQLTSLPPGGQQSALLPALLPGPRSWQPAACSSKPSQKPPPPQATPSRPARLLYPQSCLPHSIHLQAALFEALLAVPNFFPVSYTHLTLPTSDLV